MNKQQLASKIWEAANGMRASIEASEYKDYILGFIFYKFISEQEENYLEKKMYATEEEIKEIKEDSDEAKSVQKNLGYFIEYKNLFSTWIKMGADFTIENVTTALSAFNRLINPEHSKVFKDIFHELETKLSKLGRNTTEQTKAVKDLIHLIKIIPMDNKQDYDVLGFVYEYLISNFAANAGKKAGEFYTPHEVSVLMSEIIAEHLKDCDSIKIYDPTSGSGSLLINIGQSIAKHIKDKNKIKYYAQELKDATYNLTRMNLVMKGILPYNIVTRCGDTLKDDWPYFDDNDKENTYEPLTNLDAVVSNPPYSQKWDPKDRQFDPRFKNYGIAPKSKADYAFLLHDLYHLRTGGILTIVLPHGVLFRGGEEAEIRKNLIENNNIDAIIGLPANIFYGTGIPTIIMVLKKGRLNNDVLIIDASKGFVKVGKNNKLQSSDIKKIVDTVIKRESVSKFSRVVSRKEIRDNEYNLNISRYVDSSDEQETYDIYASMYGGIPNSEIERLDKYWKSFPTLNKELFKSTNDEYSALAIEDLKTAIENNVNVKSYKTKFNSAFESLKSYLKSELIDKMAEINVANEENIFAENIFNRLASIPLIDKYKAYQLLDDEWTKIAIDLEIIQTEGFDSTKQVDPNIVTKKKDSKDVEVQDGYIGHVIPFELIHKTLLKTQYDEIKDLESQLANITNEYAELLENISEDDKQGNSELFNEDNTAFVSAEITKQVKALLKSKETFAEDSFEDIILKVNELVVQEKELKKELKTKTTTLLSDTKSTIENLTNEQVLSLLEEKWISPLVKSLNELPNVIINDLVSRVTQISEKYGTTLVELEEKIKEAENSLSTLLEELEGNEYDMKAIKEFVSLLRRC